MSCAPSFSPSMTVRPRLPAMERWFVFWVYVKLKKMICSAEPHVGRLDIEQVSGQEYRIDAWCTHVLRRDRSNGNTDQAKWTSARERQEHEDDPKLHESHQEREYEGRGQDRPSTP